MQKGYDENLLLGYVEGELNAADEARVLRWMDQDPRLAHVLTQMRVDRAAVSSMPGPPPPRWIMENVESRMERSMLMDGALPAGGERHWARLGVIGVLTGIAAVLAIVGGVILWSLLSVNGGVDRKEVTAKVDPGSRDGSRISGDNAPPRGVEVEGSPGPAPVSPAVAEYPERSGGLEDLTQNDDRGSDPADIAGAPHADFQVPWRIDLKAALEPPSKRLAEASNGDSTEQASPAAKASPTRSTLRVFARPQERRSDGALDLPDRLKSPAAAMVGVTGRDAVEAYVARAVASPPLALNSRIEIVTHDTARTAAALKDLSEPYDGQPDAPQLRVRADRLVEALAALSAEASHVSVKLLTPNPEATKTTSPPNESGARPDYTGILTEQLPGTAAPADPLIITIPAVIRQTKG